MKKITRIQTIETEYFVNGEFEWEIKDLLTILERFDLNDEHDYEDNLCLSLISKGIGEYSKIKKYLVEKEVVFFTTMTNSFGKVLNEIMHCNENKRHELYHCVLKVFNEGSC